jgi:predicted alpha/beta superfamily hydrolase
MPLGNGGGVRLAPALSMSVHHSSPDGTLRLHRRFRSRVLGNMRDVVVWLPPGIDGRKRRHPVVYFQDGQNIFDPLTAFLGNAWHAGRTAAELMRAGAIVPPIMVGVYNTGFGRMDEYAPTRGEFSGWDGEKCRSRGRARAYAKFVAEEVKPFIDARYPTLTGPEHTAVVGSSMGGLAALYVALWHPRVFGHAGLLSPSVWWDDLTAVRFVTALKRKPAVRVWLDTGTAEPGWKNARLMRDALTARGWREGDDLRYVEDEGAEHHEAAWAARTGPLLKWLWPARAL